MNVLIPCAGIGSRLGYFTKNFNKAMIQVGLKPVISHIIENYPLSTNFIIALGYKGNHIEEFLKMAYPKRKFKFVNISNFDGAGSGLTHTLQKCAKFINGSFIFHANDSLVINNRYIKNLKEDTLMLSNNKSDSIRYRTASFEKKFIKEIYDKKNYQLDGVNNYIGVSFIKDYKKFIKSIRDDKENLGEVSYFLNQIKSNKKINFKILNSWFDVGDTNYYKKVNNQFKGINILPKNDQGIFFIKNKVYKFFTNFKILQKRYQRSSQLKKLVPKILQKKKYFYSYKYINGKILSDSTNIDNDLKNLLKWSETELWKQKILNKTQTNKFYQNCHDFYYEKTLNRLDLFFSNTNLIDKECKINNILVPSLEKIISLIDWKELSKGIPVNYHGDFHFENIIKVNEKKFFLLDFRESFGNSNNVGDKYYDLAKLKHGFELNHKIIKDELFSIKENNGNINFDIYKKENFKNCEKILENFIMDKKLNSNKIEVLKNLIFLNISALYSYPYSNFLYYMGKYKLYKSITNI